MTAVRAALPSSLVVDEVSERGAISSLASEWERLRVEAAAQGSTRGPFLAPSWFSVYAASLAPRPSALKLLIAHQSGRVRGLLPLLVERRTLAGVPARLYRSLSDDHSQRFDLLVDGEEAAGALWAHLERDRSWDAIELRDVLDDGSLTGADRLLAAARRTACPTVKWSSMRSPYLPLPPSTGELDRLSSAKFRSNLRRRERKLAAEVGAIELERITDARGGELDRALEDGFRLEASGWKGERGTAIACDPTLFQRYRSLARSSGDRLSLYFLKVGGVRRAFHFALVEEGVYYLFKPGFDPELSTYGLGHLLVDAVARDLIARGVRELDFLGDEMPWKREWTDRARAHSWRYVFRNAPFGRALHAWKFRAVPALKRLERRFRKE